MVEITHQISQFHHQTSKKDQAVSSNSRRKTIMDHHHHSKAEIQEIGAHQVKHAMMTAPAAMAAIKGETAAAAAVVVAAVVDTEAAHVR